MSRLFRSSPFKRLAMRRLQVLIVSELKNAGMIPIPRLIVSSRSIAENPSHVQEVERLSPKIQELFNLGTVEYGSQNTNDAGLPVVSLVVSKGKYGLSMDVKVAGARSLEQGMITRTGN
jgi:hypothetical protein